MAIASDLTRVGSRQLADPCSNSLSLEKVFIDNRHRFVGRADVIVHDRELAEDVVELAWLRAARRLATNGLRAKSYGTYVD
ncbi:MAG TPA: hypothetical protein VLE93_02705 [Candidatus Saccharimonadales bacterium]|nr:hypothetical protein [Candidatus Saccharimonadales bacterium]